MIKVYLVIVKIFLKSVESRLKENETWPEINAFETVWNAIENFKCFWNTSKYDWIMTNIHNMKIVLKSLDCLWNSLKQD